MKRPAKQDKKEVVRVRSIEYTECNYNNLKPLFEKPRSYPDAFILGGLDQVALPDMQKTFESYKQDPLFTLKSLHEQVIMRIRHTMKEISDKLTALLTSYSPSLDKSILSTEAEYSVDDDQPFEEFIISEWSELFCKQRAKRDFSSYLGTLKTIDFISPEYHLPVKIRITEEVNALYHSARELMQPRSGANNPNALFKAGKSSLPKHKYFSSNERQNKDRKRRKFLGSRSTTRTSSVSRKDPLSVRNFR
jgi:hypothetical protein